ncbi:LysR substrate-binding domain-containing protein [Kiloniella litopenaei]|uniref:LysR substrate-binding domain-containing protein n=1 Tax=Kiloniella litopenaei TaxID=1549748 RepID=UPI003BAAF337
MNSDFLKSLLALSQEGSIAQAAQSQGLTATAVSQRIKALEEQIGFSLTIRSGKTVQLTEAGQRILPHAKQLLDIERDMVSALNQGQMSGRIELGIISTAMTGIIPQTLCLLQDDQHDLDIKLHPGTSKQLYNRLLTNDLDAVIISAPPFPIPKELKYEIVNQEPLCLIAAHNSLPNTYAKTPHTKITKFPPDLRQELRQKPFIRYDHNAWGGKLVSNFLQDNKIMVQEFCELDALEAITVLVHSGLGISLIPDWQGPWPEGVNLHKIILDDTRYYRKTILLRKRSTARETVISYISNTMKHHQAK